jgi:hypothetical protein
MPSRVEGLLDRLDDVERDIRRAHKRLRQSIPSYLAESRPLNLVAALRQSLKK